MKQDFLNTVFGDASLGTFLGYIVLALAGHIINLVVQAADRDKNSTNTPFNFSWAFLMKDNAWETIKSGFLNAIVIFLCIRFSPDLLHTAISPIVAIGVGYGLTALTNKLQQGKLIDGFKIGLEGDEIHNEDGKTLQMSPGIPKDPGMVKYDFTEGEKVVAKDDPGLRGAVAGRLPTLVEIEAYAASSISVVDPNGSPVERAPTIDEINAYAVKYVPL